MSSSIKFVSLSLTVFALTALASCQSQAASPPTQVGQCSDTFVAEVGTRLTDGATGEPIVGSGTSVQLTNGIYLVSYDTVSEAETLEAGDKVQACLDSVPQNCPPGDNRGKIYSILNYRTQQNFTMPDFSHSCGGA